MFVERATSPGIMVCPACNARYDIGTFCAVDGTRLIPAPASENAAASLVGQVIADRYRIQSLLGEGGMGQVYEAQHVHINKRFAIKLLRPEIVSNPEAVARFRQEARSASSIGHENIVEIEDFATLADGSVYLAMEFLQGQSLAERLRSGEQISLAEALGLMIQLCEGLTAAHDKGIVHRDLKPENLFLAQKSGRVVVKILDFGIAKVSGAAGEVAGPGTLTRTGTIFGTPHFMSPEQALGKTLDHRSDIYSVGVILFQLFTGRVPFEAESFMGILTKHITADVPRPSAIAPERNIPDSIERVILKALEKDPSARPQKMSDLLEELRAIRDGAFAHTIAASPVSLAKDPSHKVAVTEPVFPVELQKKRSRLVPLLLALLIAGGSAALWFTLGASNAPLKVVKADSPVLRSPEAKLSPKIAPVVPTPAAGSQLVEVIVDSTPPGALIYKGDKLLGDTPEAIQVPAGQTLDVILKKLGFIDEPIRIDPQKGHKLVLKLDREAGEREREKHHEHAPIYTEPPAAPRAHSAPSEAEAPNTAPGNTAPGSAAPRRKAAPAVDPYPRLEDTPKKGSEVINPYN